MKAFEADFFSPLAASRENGQPLTGLKLWAKLPQRRSFREQVRDGNTQHPRQKHQLTIRDPAQLRLQFSNRPGADAPALELKLLRKNRLSPAFPHSKLLHLWPNHIQSELHRRLTLSATWPDSHSHMGVKYLKKVLAISGRILEKLICWKVKQLC